MGCQGLIIIDTSYLTHNMNASIGRYVWYPHALACQLTCPPSIASKGKCCFIGVLKILLQVSKATVHFATYHLQLLIYEYSYDVFFKFQEPSVQILADPNAQKSGIFRDGPAPDHPTSLGACKVFLIAILSKPTAVYPCKHEKKTRDYINPYKWTDDHLPIWVQNGLLFRKLNS